MLDNDMMNSTFNITTEGATENYLEYMPDGILLLVAVFVIVLDLMVIAALIATSEIVSSIRWILSNLLVAGAMGALGSTVYHLSQVVAVASFEPDHLELCRASLYIMSIGNAGRVLMTTFYAVTVFIVVRWWNKPVLAPRNTKYFIIGAVFTWLSVIPLVVVFVADPGNVGVILCTRSSNDTENSNGITGTAVVMVLSAIPILFTILFLVMTVCFIKKHTIRESSATERALLRFGVFATIGQGMNAFGQIICPSLLLVLSSHRDRSVIITILGTIFVMSLFTAPILIVILFTPVWHKLRQWFCINCKKCSFQLTTATQATTRPA